MWRFFTVKFSFFIIGFGYPLNYDESSLFLTPFLNNGSYIQAQELSKVGGKLGSVTSYSGFLTVDEQCKSHLFFWFFPSFREDWQNAPLLLWLQGGPGGSSLYGLFEELGPLEVTKHNELKKRKYSWNTENNVIFIDQPVGTGFSFTESGCYAKDQNNVGDNLYEALIQFYKLFPQLAKNKFFVAGESFAGHYIPAIGHTIHKRNPSAQVKINLSALMIGNGIEDVSLQIDFASYLYQLGLVDDRRKKEFKNLQKKFLTEFNLREWSKAIETRNSIIDLYMDSVGGNRYKYNFLKPIDTRNSSYVSLLNNPNVQRLLHVGNRHYQILNHIVYVNLYDNIIQSVKPWVEELLPFYPIIFYYGQLDIVEPYALGINFIRSLNWESQNRYLDASRSNWCVGKEQAGYFKGEHHLYDVLVRGAGHMVPMDQPHWAYELVNSVTSGTPDNPLHALKTCD